MAENGSVVELSAAGVRIVDTIEAGMTFVDGLGVGDVKDVALRDRRRLSEDGVLIVVATLGSSNGASATAPPELIARGFAGSEELLAETREEAARVLDELLGAGRDRDQAPAGAPARRDRAARLRPYASPTDDPPGGRRGMSLVSLTGGGCTGRSPAPPPPATAAGTMLSGAVLGSTVPPASHHQRPLRNPRIACAEDDTTPLRTDLG